MNAVCQPDAPRAFNGVDYYAKSVNIVYVPYVPQFYSGSFAELRYYIIINIIRFVATNMRLYFVIYY